jgi:hypothetical protein
MKHFILILIFPFCISAQPNAKQIIAIANSKFNKVNSYTANINLQFNIPGVQLEPIAGKVFYKKPDKFRIHAKGIIFLPKQNPYFALQSVRDTNSFTAVISGEEKVGNILTRVVNVIPNDATGDLILAKLWIDEVKYLVHKAKLTTKNSGTISIEQYFGNEAETALPGEMKFVVDMAKFKVPKAMTMELNSKAKTGGEALNARGIGEIKLNFSKYKLNEQFSDTVFSAPKL